MISFLVQVLSGFLICAVLYLQTPEMLYSPKDELDDLIQRLADHTREDCGDLIDDFIRRTGMDLAFYDEESYKSKQYNTPLDNIGTLTIKDLKSLHRALDHSESMGTYGLMFKDDPGMYIVQYFSYGGEYNLIPRALHNSYALMIAVVVVLSLISSFIYTVVFARPVRKLSKVSGQMAKMDFSVKCDDRRGDEIGDLARDLNALSAALDRKIGELEEEIVRVREMEEQKEMFFAAASHELKTPVTILEGHLRGMIEGVGPYEDHDEYLAKSLRTVKRMESLIGEILTASRMQSSHEVVMGSVDMAEILDGKLSESDDLFTVRNISVNRHIDKGLFFTGNRELMQLAAGAFISNAVFYSHEGSSIDVTARRDGDNIVTVIENKGAHIDDKDIGHLFEPFYRTDSSRSSRSGGSGLGLYLARLIITKHGGSVSLDNTADGVCARIVLNSVEEL